MSETPTALDVEISIFLPPSAQYFMTTRLDQFHDPGLIRQVAAVIGHKGES